MDKRKLTTLINNAIYDWYELVLIDKYGITVSQSEPYHYKWFDKYHLKFIYPEDITINKRVELSKYIKHSMIPTSIKRVISWKNDRNLAV